MRAGDSVSVERLQVTLEWNGLRKVGVRITHNSNNSDFDSLNQKIPSVSVAIPSLQIN